MRRALLLYGIVLPTAAVLIFLRLVPENDPLARWGYGGFGTSPETRAALQRYSAAMDTTLALEAALLRLDSRERARGVASHRSGLLVQADRGVHAETEAAMRRTAHAELAAIGASEPRYPVAVLITMDPRREYPLYHRAIVMPVEPGAPCTVVLHIPERMRRATRVGNMDRLLGSCGFYAAYGAPGAGMRDWLVRTGLASAGFLQRPPSHGDGIIRDPAEANATGRGVDMAACRAGRMESCERLFTSPTDQTPEWQQGWRDVSTGVATPGVLVTTPFTFGAARNSLTAGLLASIASDLGAERFGRLWTSDRPPVEAFEAAAGRPLAEWIAERVATVVRPYRAGPSLGWGRWISTLVLIAAASVVGIRFAPGRVT